MAIQGRCKQSAQQIVFCYALLQINLQAKTDPTTAAIQLEASGAL
jgi:hypothetical protein